MITPAISVLGAVEGLEVATPFFEPLRRADHGRDPGRPVRDPAARHAPGRPDLRADHGGLVRHDRRARHRLARAATRWCWRRSIRGTPWRSSASTAGTASRCSARSSSSSPAAKRSTPTWATSAACRSASPGSALVLPALLLNYFGQGALLLRNPTRRRTAVLPARAELGAAAARRARHRGGDHRLAGADLRRVLADPAGDPARLLPAPRHRAHLPRRDRADLRAGGQLGADGRTIAARPRVRLVDRAGRRLRHRRDADDGDHHVLLSSSRSNAGSGRRPWPTP